MKPAFDAVAGETAAAFFVPAICFRFACDLPAIPAQKGVKTAKNTTNPNKENNKVRSRVNRRILAKMRQKKRPSVTDSL